MRSPRSTNRAPTARLAVLIIAGLGLTACSPDPLLEEELRASAVPAAQEVAGQLASIDLPGATPLAAQEADLCTVHSTRQIGNDGNPRWRCATYAIQVLEWPSDNLDGLETTLTMTLDEAGFDGRTIASSFEWLQEIDGVARASGQLDSGTRVSVAVGQDSVAYSDVVSPPWSEEQLLSSTGDEVLTVPTQDTTPITYDCLQIWLIVYKNYGGAPV